MLWIVFTLVAAVFNALKNVATRAVGERVDVYSVALFSSLASLPVLWINVALLSDGFAVQPTFWLLMVAMIPVEVLVMVLLFKALTNSNLAHSFPFVSFMPVFVAIGSYFILGEVTSLLMYVGMLVIVAGAFLTHLSKDTDVADVKGALYILSVAALWGYLIPMGSLAIDYSSAQLYPAIFFTLAAIAFIPVYLSKRTTPLRAVLVENGRQFLLIGVLFGLFTASNWYAYSYGFATGVSALQMISILFTSIAAVVFYKEKFVPRKLLAGAIMTAGAVLVILG